MLLNKESVASVLKKKQQSGEFDTRCAELLNNIKEFHEVCQNLGDLTHISPENIAIIFSMGMEIALESIETEIVTSAKWVN